MSGGVDIYVPDSHSPAPATRRRMCAPNTSVESKQLFYIATHVIDEKKTKETVKKRDDDFCLGTVLLPAISSGCFPHLT